MTDCNPSPFDCNPLQPAEGKDTSWCIAPEAGFPDSKVLWLWVKGQCYPVRLKNHPIGALSHILKGHTP